MEMRIAHLGFIQSIISRMGANSFLLKGWSVTLVAAMFALSAKEANYKFVVLSYFPIFVFWALDAYFLHQEKLYRKLYEEVAEGRIKSETMSLDATGMSPNVSSIANLAFRDTLLLFHGAITAVVLVAMFLIMR